MCPGRPFVAAFGYKLERQLGCGRLPEPHLTLECVPMTTRIATCTSEPARISVCHRLNCQKRSGSSFVAQARWPDDRVSVAGAFNGWSHTGDNGNRATFRFCPTCGYTVFYTAEGLPGLTAIGALGDPIFPAPHYSVYGARKHRWVAILGDDVEYVA